MLWLSYFAMLLLLLVGALMIFIILLQRGRGGGLAGALGGMGGQSAFGTKAGDMFTRITVVLALIWIVLCAGQIPILRAVAKKYTGGADANDMLQAAPIKEAGAKSNLELPATGDDKSDLSADQKAEKETTESSSAPVGKEKPADKPADEVKDEAKPEQPAAGEAKTEPESKPATETKEVPADKPAAEPEQKSESEPAKQP